MYDEELREIYKDAKRSATDLFTSSSLGEDSE